MAKPFKILRDKMSPEAKHRSKEMADEMMHEIRLTEQAQPGPKYKTRIITSPITGFPVLTSGPNAPVLTNEMVEEILADFP